MFWNTKSLRMLLFLGIAVSFVSCADDDEEVSGETPVSFTIPAGFPAPVYDFTNNPVKTATFELGRQLFYDPLLSRDSSTSCGSCHQQFGAFAHVDHDVSHGIDNLTGNRNSPPIYNLAWHSNFFWDGGSNHLETQPIAPITNPVEMDETLANVVVKLQRSSFYPAMFKSAFGSDSITSAGMLKALAQFMALLVSADSRYDTYRNGGGGFSTQEVRGLTLFRQHCENCHKEPLLTDLSYRNNGLDSVFTDAGRATITLVASDSGKFKVPSLRNIVESYPYMHDGRFTTLNQVLNHYSSGVKISSTLDPALGGPIALSQADKDDLIAFLKTLSDPKFLNDTRFSEP